MQFPRSCEDFPPLLLWKLAVQGLPSSCILRVQGGQVDRESLCAAAKLNKDEDVVWEIDSISPESQNHCHRGVPKMSMLV